MVLRCFSTVIGRHFDVRRLRIPFAGPLLQVVVKVFVEYASRFGYYFRNEDKKDGLEIRRWQDAP